MTTPGKDVLAFWIKLFISKQLKKSLQLGIFQTHMLTVVYPSLVTSTPGMDKSLDAHALWKLLGNSLINSECFLVRSKRNGSFQSWGMERTAKRFVLFA